MKINLALVLLLIVLTACGPANPAVVLPTPSATAAVAATDSPPPAPSPSPTARSAAPAMTDTPAAIPSLPSMDQTLSAASQPRALAGAPQKGYLAVVSDTGVFVYRIAELSVRVSLLWSAAVPGAEGPRRVAFSPGGELLLVSTPDSLSLWDAAAGKAIWSIRMPDPALGESGKDPGLALHTLAFSPDSRTIATMNGLGEIVLRNVINGQPVKRLPTGDPGVSAGLVFSPDGKSLASATGRYLIVFNMFIGQAQPLGKALSLGQTLWGARPQRDGIVYTSQAVAYAPDGKTLYSVGNETLTGAGGEIIQWDARTGERLARYDTSSPNAMPYPDAMLFSPDGKTLALRMGCEGDGVALWDAEKMEFSACLLKGRSVSAMVYVTNRVLAVGDGTHPVVLVETLSQQPRAVLTEFAAPVQAAVASTPLPAQPAPTSVHVPTLPVYPHRAIAVGNSPSVIGSLPLDLAFTPLGELRVATGVGLYHLTRAGQPEALFTWEKQPEQVFLSADGYRVGATTLENGLLTELWDAQRRQPLRSLVTPQGDGSGAPAFSADGSRLAVKTADDVFEVLDTKTGESLARWQDPTIQGWMFDDVVFAPDGEALAAGHWETVSLWDFAGKPAASTYGCRGNVIFDQAYSPDGRWLAIACAPRETETGFFVLLRVADRQVIHFWGEAEQIQSLAFSSDGSILAAGLQNGEIRFYDAHTLNPAGFPSLQTLGSLQAHTAPVFRLAFSPGGKYLASADRDGVVLLWELK